jgi:hypothetical protein
VARRTWERASTLGLRLSFSGGEPERAIMRRIGGFR